MLRLLFILILAGSLAACQSAGSDSNANTNPPQPKEEAPATSTQTITYPGLPVEKLAPLYETCDYIDYLFYGMNFSMSQSDQPAIQASLAHISDEPVAVNPSCQPTGHIFYQVQGENKLEADMYFQEQCVYFVFYEDGKPAYANKMTTNGLSFFKTVFTRVQQGNTGQ